MSLRNNIILRWFLVILLVMPVFNFGGLQGAASSTVIPVSIENPAINEALIIGQAAAMLDSSNEALVTVTLKNNRSTVSVAGFVATGYDLAGEAIETNTYYLDNGWGTPKKVAAGAELEQQTLRLKAGAQIASVVVSPLGMHNDVRIISSAYRVEGEDVIASAVVENATMSEKMAGVLAEAKNADGFTIQVKAVTPVNFSPEPVKSLAAVRLELIFEGAASDFDDMNFTLTGESTGIELLSKGVQIQNDQWNVTAVVENGLNIETPVGFTVTGYDDNDIPIETATGFSRDSFGAKPVQPHVPVELKAVLTAGDRVKRIETKVTGISKGKELLSFGINNVGDQYKITGVVENGTDIASELELIARSYDYSGELIEQKRVKTNGFFEKEKIIPPHAPALLSITLRDANVEKIVIDTPEKIDTTQNIVYIVDEKAPYITSSFSAQNTDVKGTLSIAFNENIFQDTGFEEIKLVNGNGVKSPIEPFIEQNSLTITLKEILDLESSYFLRIPGTALKDQVGNPLGTNIDYPFQTKPEAGTVEDYIIVKGNETWNPGYTFEKSVIIPPNAVFTIPEGATFIKDLIQYGTLQRQGSFTVEGTWYMGAGFKVPPVSINSYFINAEDEFTLKGKTVPGFIMNVGEQTATADEEGNFTLTGRTAAEAVLVEVTDNFNNQYPAKKLTYGVQVGELNLKIEETIAAINAIPSIDLITLEDETAVTVAREKVTAALEAGADETQIDNLDVLISAEGRIAELKLTKKAIEEAVAAIETLPSAEILKLTDEPKLTVARELVKKALDSGGVKSDITNLSKLESLEDRITYLVAVKQESVQKAITAIGQLPAIETLKLSDDALVMEARWLVSEAIVEGASKSEFTNLDVLVNLEEKLASLWTVVNDAVSAISQLPSVGALTVADKERVEHARYLVNKAIEIGITKSEIYNLNKLLDLEKRLIELRMVQQAVEDAISAIKDLPEVSALSLADEPAVNDARGLVNKALELGVSESEISNLAKLVQLGEKLGSLLMKQQVVDNAIEAVANLPEVEAIRLDHQSGVMMARQMVDRAFELGALPEEITNLEKLILIEGRLVVLQEIENAVVETEIAIARLPYRDSIRLEDEPDVVVARELVNIALEKGAIESEIHDLYKLTWLESRLVEMNEILDEVMKAIEALPSVEDLGWEDEERIMEARALVNYALNEGATEQDITNLAKLISIEKILPELAAQMQKAISEAIVAAECAISSLPSIENLQIAVEAAVNEARKLVDLAMEIGADQQSFTYWDELMRLEDQLQHLKYVRKERIQEAIESIHSLPAVVKITLDDMGKVERAREKVKSALRAEAKEKDISNLDKLKAIEERISYLDSNKDITAPEPPVVYEVTDYDLYVRGKAEPGAVNSVKIGGNEIGSGVAKADGTFSVEIPAYFTPGSTITVITTDKEGNVSKPTTVVTVKVMNGWKYTNGTWFYIQSGEMETGWKYIGNKWYHFSQWGAMKTGWLYDNYKWYYLSSNGDMVTGWVRWDDKWYYLDGGGVMKTGWVRSGGRWYYLDGGGVMKTGWVKSGGKWYYLDGGGVMKTGWVRSGGKWYYLASSGVMKTGWVLSGGKWYYLYGNGIMAYSTIIGEYRLGANGAWIK